MVMRKREKKYTEEEERLLQELRQYRESGCSICLNGKPCMPEKVAAVCFRENVSYMRDLVSDEKDHIRKIDFVRIREKNK